MRIWPVFFFINGPRFSQQNIYFYKQCSTTAIQQFSDGIVSFPNNEATKTLGKNGME